MDDPGSYEGWPTDGGPATFEALAEAIRNLLTQTHLVEPRDDVGDDLRSFYKGPDLPQTASIHSLCTCLSPASVEFAREDQNRDRLDLIIAASLRLGIEQGYRIAMKDHDLSVAKMGIECLLVSFGSIIDEQKKRGDERFTRLRRAGAILNEDSARFD